MQTKTNCHSLFTWFPSAISVHSRVHLSSAPPYSRFMCQLTACSRRTRYWNRAELGHSRVRQPLDLSDRRYGARTAKSRLLSTRESLSGEEWVDTGQVPIDQSVVPLDRTKREVLTKDKLTLGQDYTPCKPIANYRTSLSLPLLLPPLITVHRNSFVIKNLSLLKRIADETRYLYRFVRSNFWKTSFVSFKQVNWNRSSRLMYTINFLSWCESHSRFNWFSSFYIYRNFTFIFYDNFNHVFDDFFLYISACLRRVLLEFVFA